SSLTMQTRRIFSDSIDALFARIGSSGNEVWYLPDIHSIRNLVDSDGTLIDHLDYTTFGGISYESSSSNGDRYKYTGREWEAEAEIQYNRARYLQYGRWMSEDPMGFGAGDNNLSRYLHNSPPNDADPSGKQPGTIPRSSSVRPGTAGTARA